MEPYRLPGDGWLNRRSRRCIRPRYDKPSVKRYGLPVAKDIPLMELPYPVEERWASPLTAGYRPPHLPAFWWEQEEKHHEPTYTIPETRIQIFSIMDAVNRKTLYLLERTAHPVKKWKRMMVTYHLSEPCLHRPHVVDEFEF